MRVGDPTRRDKNERCGKNLRRLHKQRGREAETQGRADLRHRHCRCPRDKRRQKHRPKKHDRQQRSSRR